MKKMDLKNYIDNGSAENGKYGWKLFSDTASNIPTDGTGGTATGLTLNASTASPLDGDATFELIQSAVNCQGKGVSYDFTISDSDKAQVLSIKFDYNASSTFTTSNGTTGKYDGTTTTNAGNSDLEVFIYDITNAKLIIPAGTVIVGKGSTNFTFTGTFQTAIDSNNYRLILMVATANTAGWTFKFDNVYVGRQATSIGPAISDWQSYTPTITSATGTITNYTASGSWRRIGDSIVIHARLYFTGAVGTWTGPEISLPPGLAVDFTKLVNIDGALTPTVYRTGSARISVSTTNVAGKAVISETVGNKIRIGAFFTNTSDAGSTSDPLGTLSSTAIANNWPGSFANGDAITIEDIILPIVGWSSNTVQSADTDARVVAVRAGRASSNQTLNPYNSRVKIEFFSTTSSGTFDTHGCFSSTQYQYKIPVSGYYRIVTQASFLNTNVQANSRFILSLIDDNSSEIARGQDYTTHATGSYFTLSLNTTLYLNAGSVVAVGVFTPSDYSANGIILDGNNRLSYLSIERVSGPAVVQATETVAARYTASGTLSCALNNPVPITLFSNKTFDSHNAFTPSIGYIAPVSGKYRATFIVCSNSTTAGVISGNFQAMLYVAGTLHSSTQTVCQTTTAVTYSVLLTDTFNLLAGQAVMPYFNNNNMVSAGITIGPAIFPMFFEIERIGN
jgi:hypothetical protein